MRALIPTALVPTALALLAVSFPAAAQDRNAQRARDDAVLRRYYQQQYIQNQPQNQRPFESPFGDGRQQRSVPPSGGSVTVPNR